MVGRALLLRTDLPPGQRRRRWAGRCDITKVKGVLLATSAIGEVVRGVAGLGDEYEVIVDRIGESDCIKLRVEVLPEAQNQCRLIEEELSDQLRLKTNPPYDLEICGCETLPRYEVKAKRFKDLRRKINEHSIRFKKD